MAHKLTTIATPIDLGDVLKKIFTDDPCAEYSVSILWGKLREQGIECEWKEFQDTLRSLVQEKILTFSLNSNGTDYSITFLRVDSPLASL